ncbi:MlaD family protein [Nocardia sp. CDC159]|uniref:MlaD family protein n=1 Tax=Nocardia pulmonis TaxID=2951408 RepID=A0A9X2IX48_9NOCA|nr:MULTISPECIES: MlaD family protein [Nocardia]MCM6772541.1 MlaD family protein [Nocardia pulmonis]MCM6784801.1 MlaD family protein [Nocardia sp. CDC159]
MNMIGTRRGRGAAVVVAAMVAGAVVLAQAQGRFHDGLDLVVDAPTVADGLVAGSDVKFHGMVIGRVREVTDARRVRLRIDPGAAAALPGALVARFTSTNVFGSPAVELVARGTGGRVRDRAVIPLAEDAIEASSTAVLQRSGRLTAVLDSPQVRRLMDLAARDPGIFVPTVDAITELARAVATNRRGDIGYYLRIAGNLAAGSAELEPAMAHALVALLDQSAYFDDEANRARTRTAIAGLSREFLPGYAELFGGNLDSFTKILAVVMDLGVPLGMSYGSLAPAYQRLPELMDRIGAAFPVVDGRVQLQLRIIGETLPQVARSVGAR